jgi:uncharacterized coiled-coil DUF342 family protein
VITARRARSQRDAILALVGEELTSLHGADSLAGSMLLLPASASNAELAQLHATVGELTASVGAMKAERRELAASVKALKAENRQLVAAAGKPRGENVELTASVARLEAENGDVKAYVERLEAETTEAAGHVERLVAENHELSALVEASEAANRELRAGIEAAEASESDQRSGEVQALRTRLREEIAARAESVQRVAQLEAYLSDLAGDVLVADVDRQRRGLFRRVSKAPSVRNVARKPLAAATAPPPGAIGSHRAAEEMESVLDRRLFGP